MNHLVITDKNVYRVDGLENFKGAPKLNIPPFKGYSACLKSDKVLDNKNIKVNIEKNFIQSTKNVKKVSSLLKNLFQLNGELQNTWNYVMFEDDDIVEMYNSDMKDQELSSYAKRALSAMNIIQANSFKADIFRYYYLYTRGGVWMDDKCVLRYSLDDPIFELNKYDGFFVYDYISGNIEIAFMATKAKSILFKDLLEQCLSNIEKRFYGKEWLEVTGPSMATKLIKKEVKNIPKDILTYKGLKYKILTSVFATVYVNNSLIWKQSAIHDINLQRLFDKDHYLQVWSDARLYKDDNSNYTLNFFSFYSKLPYVIFTIIFPVVLCLTLYFIIYK